MWKSAASPNSLARVEAIEVPGVAGPCDVDPQWGPVAARIADKTRHWDDQVSVDRLEESGATVLHGRARLAGEKRVEVDGRTFTARQGVVLATGTRPGVPPVDGLEGTPYWTNRDIVKVTELPESLVVMGGGPIGCELAQAMVRFGVEVTRDMREGLSGADIVMMLRLQRERMNGSFVPSVQEYFAYYGLDQRKLAFAKPDALVMHPGPMNRGVEIASTVADHSRSVIREQVEMGVAVRMAVLEALSAHLPSFKDVAE